MKVSKIKVYTDGACSNNPGPGGWGVVFTGQEKLKVLSGFNVSTTNNKMELKAVVEAMKYIADNVDSFNSTSFEILSDSAYVVNAINSHWITKWMSNGWKTSKGGFVKNKYLWETYFDLYHKLKGMGVCFNVIKVKGHSGDTYNEYIDGIAKREASKARMFAASNDIWR